MYEGVTLIGLPYQFGRRGGGTGYQMARGPEVLLAERAVPHAVNKWCDDLELVWLDFVDEPVDQGGPLPLSPGDQMCRTLNQNNALAQAVREASAKGRLPVISAGGCNSSLGVVAGLPDPELGMFWFDAHADAETPDTSADGLFEGMPVSTIAGMCWPRVRRRIEGFREIPVERIATVGLHDTRFVQPEEPRPGIGSLVDPREVAKYGFEGAFDRALEKVSAHANSVYVHIDTDVVDPAYMRGHRHTAPGGPSPDQLIWAVGRLASTMRIAAVNFACYDPEVDPRARGVLIPLVSEVARLAAASGSI